MLNDRRSCPRYLLELPLVVQLPTAEAFTATSISVSRSSIEFACNAELVTTLLQQPRLPYIGQLQFSLPTFAMPFEINAHLLTQRRLSKQDYVVVMLWRGQQDALLQQLQTALAATGSAEE